MGLFRHQDQHRDNSCDVDWNEARGEQQVQDGRCGVSDRVHRFKMAVLIELKRQTVMFLKNACKMTGF